MSGKPDFRRIERPDNTGYPVTLGTDREPTTEAGRALLDEQEPEPQPAPFEGMKGWEANRLRKLERRSMLRQRILAVEAEARAPLQAQVAALRERVGKKANAWREAAYDSDRTIAGAKAAYVQSAATILRMAADVLADLPAAATEWEEQVRAEYRKSADYARVRTDPAEQEVEG